MKQINLNKMSATSDHQKPRPDHKKIPTWLWITLAAIGAGSVFIVTTLIVIGLSAKNSLQNFQLHVQDTTAIARQAYDTFKNQDLAGTKAKLVEVKSSFEQTKAAYSDLQSPLTLYGHKDYYEDGLQVMAAVDEGLVLANRAIEIMEPAAQMLGFGEDKEEGDGTTEDRVKKLLDTLQLIGPQLDEVIADLEKIAAHLQTIDSERYPEKLGDLLGSKLALNYIGKPELAETPVRALIASAQSSLATAIDSLRDYRPILDKIPEMAGSSGERKKYFVLFQNNNELRPTGGFLTAYAIIYIEDGKVTPDKSDDIYELDKKFKKKITIPAKLGKYLTTEKYWNLRDMNIDPDFKNSMETFLENYELVPDEPQDIDGIIAIDTQVLTKLIDILGPIHVDGYGDFSTEPDQKYGAPQIVVALSEIITRPTPYIREDRKGILGPMMKSMLEKVYGASKEQFPDLFAALLELINGRHLQAYFLDEDLQESAEKINVAGRMIAPTDGSDFLAIIDANLGGAKSNLFIDYKVSQTVLAPENGTLTKRVVIDYTNSRPGDNCNLEAGLLCLNATNNDWFRLYLPLGSTLTSAKGFKGEPEVYDENGFTVIDGYFNLNPNSTAKLDLELEIPYQDQTNYRLNIWQQSGLRPVKHLLDVNGNEQEITVTGDTQFETKF